MKYLTLIFIAAFFSCKDFKKEIPKGKDGQNVYSYKWMKILTEKSKIKNLEEGIDSMCIRLWFSGSFRDTVKVIELKNENHIWTHNRYDLIVHYKDFWKDQLDVKLVSKTQTKPKSEWSTIIDSLFKLGITKLPNDLAITHYTIPNHGNDVMIEAATKDYYRLYNLPIVQFGENKTIEEAQKGIGIIRLIESEFDFKSYIK